MRGWRGAGILLNEMVGEAALGLQHLSRDLGGVRCEPCTQGESPRWRKEQPAHRIRGRNAWSEGQRRTRGGWQPGSRRLAREILRAHGSGRGWAHHGRPGWSDLFIPCSTRFSPYSGPPSSLLGLGSHCLQAALLGAPAGLTPGPFLCVCRTCDNTSLALLEVGGQAAPAPVMDIQAGRGEVGRSSGGLSFAGLPDLCK